MNEVSEGSIGLTQEACVGCHRTVGSESRDSPGHKGTLSGYHNSTNFNRYSIDAIVDEAVIA